MLCIENTIAGHTATPIRRIPTMAIAPITLHAIGMAISARRQRWDVTAAAGHPLIRNAAYFHHAIFEFVPALRRQSRLLWGRAA